MQNTRTATIISSAILIAATVAVFFIFEGLDRYAFHVYGVSLIGIVLLFAAKGDSLRNRAVWSVAVKSAGVGSLVFYLCGLYMIFARESSSAFIAVLFGFLVIPIFYFGLGGLLAWMLVRKLKK